MIPAFLILVIVAVVFSLLFALYNYKKVKNMQRGTELMGEIADAIQEGAEAFIAHEYKIIAITAAIVAILLTVLLDWMCGAAFLLGAFLSAMAGFIGMKIATISNVRVSNTARLEKSLGKTLKVAFRGGSVMGLCVGGFALLGLFICYLVFGMGLGQILPENVAVTPNWLGVTYIPFTMTISAYALGCSLVALFNRIGGGIYTKAADMGADLVGKTEAGIPEDDPRNPATIADNVGDNVGDVAGLGSDLLESYVGAIIAAVILAAYTYFTNMHAQSPMSAEMLNRLILFPITFAGMGILACIIGIAYVLFRKPSDHPHRELNVALWSSAALIIVGGAFLSNAFFKNMDFITIGFRVGAWSPWIGAVIGIVAGILIGLLAEYYTSADYKPTQNLAKITLEGTALTITKGLALGMKSTFAPVIVLAASVVGSYAVAGVYGVTMAAVGMLSFVSATVSVDTYGPIADNAGGISEMSKLDPEVRKITDKLDSVGNTTAAIGKGFAIGSGALAALSLLISFIHSQAGIEDTAGFRDAVLNIINSLTLAGAFIGAALPFFFSGMLTDAVAKSAQYMVQEVRRQFSEMPGILTGEQKPDYRRCITISAAGAIKEMKLPVAIALGVPLLGGFVLGPDFAGGILIGATLSAIMLAIFTANSGGAWDNAKKSIEQGEVEGAAKGTDAHSAAVIGDTVGDPLKDTVGPSLDILIKIMATVSLIGVSIFGQYNLLSFFGG